MSVMSLEFLRRALLLSAVLPMALALTGCSSTISRFDFPAFGLNNKDDGSSELPMVPSEPVFEDSSALAPPSRLASPSTMASASDSYVDNALSQSSGQVVARTRKMARVNFPSAAPLQNYQVKQLPTPSPALLLKP